MEIHGKINKSRIKVNVLLISPRAISTKRKTCQKQNKKKKAQIN
jgi:hypothetical protein